MRQSVLQVGDAISVDRTAKHSCHVTSHADCLVAAAEEVNRERGIALLGEPVGDVPDIFVEAVGLMDYDYAGVRARRIGKRQMASSFQKV